MEFACESVDSVVLPSLSESRNPLDHSPALRNVDKSSELCTTTSTIQETATGSKRRISPGKEPVKAKRVNLITLHADEEPPSKKTESAERETNGSACDPVIGGNRFEAKPNRRTKISKQEHKKLQRQVERWFDYVCTDIEKRKDQGECSLEFLMQTKTEHVMPLPDSSSDCIADSSSLDPSDVAHDDAGEAEISDDEHDASPLLSEEERVEELAEGSTDIEKINSIDVEGKKLVAIEQNTVVYLHGVVRICVIRGCVEVLGHEISDSTKWIDLYSPKGTSFLYIRALPTADSTSSEIDGLLPQNQDVISFIEEQTYDCSLIMCEALEKTHVAYIEKHIAQQIYPKPDNSSARYVFQKNPGDWNVITTSPEWDRVCDSITPHSKVFLCGGKGVGKSTFLRFAINRLLMKYKTIRVVDLDPGQPEFTVPGCVSAHMISEPVFGPNYTHIKKPERCIFLPNVNIAYNPKEYIHAVKELLFFYKSEEELPTLINYMGFALGIGINIACSVIAEIKPTTVIQIQSHYNKKNFPRLLTPECIAENMLILVNVTTEELSYQFVTLEALSDLCSGFTFQPRQIREMCALAYMSQVFPEGVFSLTDPSVPIYKSSLGELKLIANGSECHPAVVNGNLVALCVSHSVTSDCTLYTCHGWGVVRGIDFSTNEIFLITPESNETLESVTHLIYGSVNLPPSVYMTADDVNGVVPYVSLGTLTSFSSIPKRTHLPKQSKNK